MDDAELERAAVQQRQKPSLQTPFEWRKPVSTLVAARIFGGPSTVRQQQGIGGFRTLTSRFPAAFHSYKAEKPAAVASAVVPATEDDDPPYAPCTPPPEPAEPNQSS